MEESKLVTLLSGRRKRWLAVAWGAVLAGSLALPGVDQCFAHYQELGKLKAKLAERAALPERTRMLAQRVAQRQQEMADLEAALVPPEALSAFKQDLTRMARAAQCRLRSIHPGTTGRRPLSGVLGEPGFTGKRPAAKETWEVSEQTSSVSIQGTFTHLARFLDALDHEVRIMELASLDLHPLPETTEELVLNLNIKTFNLTHSGSKRKG